MKLEAEYGLTGKADGVGHEQSSRKQPRLHQGSRLLADSDGFSDKEDESYYGL